MVPPCAAFIFIVSIVTVCPDLDQGMMFMLEDRLEDEGSKEGTCWAVMKQKPSGDKNDIIQSNTGCKAAIAGTTVTPTGQNGYIILS